MKKIKNPALEWYKLKKMLQDKGSLTKKEYTTVLERSVDVLTYMRKQDLNIRDFMMDKSMELIRQLEMVKKINAWFKENVSESVLGKGFSPISEVKYLGQKVALGEKPNQLISVKI